ncbi:MAG: tetratricopeptide repeat protein [Gammaproteobacteria bacterium]
MAKFITELKNRNVLKVATTYALACWVFIEAGSVLMPTFGAPDWLFKIYVVVILVAFIAAVILSWVFERTPAGVKRHEESEDAATQYRPTGGKSSIVLIAMLVVALGISLTLNITGLRHKKSYNPSIAVLPFTSRSTDPENAVFADGIHDDLLTRLANIETFKVISRTSVMDYRETTKNLRQVAEELGVGIIVEGAVQRAGNTVRINVQLIDAITDEHIWAKTYDRALNAKNVFAIQSEISAAIASALKAKLSPREKARLATVPTENINAYRLYTAARSGVAKRELPELLAARQQFQQAIDLDPDYAQAYAGLADAVQLLFINHGAITWTEAQRVASAALAKALELDSNLADAYASLGLLKMQSGNQDSHMDRDGKSYEEAAVALNRAIELNPSHARAYMWLASLRDTQGRYEDAIALNKRSLEFDPIGRIPYSNLAIIYAKQGRNEDALNQWLRALEIHPSWSSLFSNISNHLEKLGRLDEAVAWSMGARELSQDPTISQNLIGIYVELGDFDKANEIIDDIPKEHPFYALSQAYSAVIGRDYQTALTRIETYATTRDEVPFYISELASDIATVAGDFDTALEYCLQLNPSFATNDVPQINEFNDRNAVKYAYLLQQKEEPERARRILEATLPVIRTQPRLGMKGQGIKDVQILALLGRNDEALDTLRTAVNQGFRSSASFDTWILEFDPYLESIRARPEFKSILENIATAIEPMRERVNESQFSGNWENLRTITREQTAI